MKSKRKLIEILFIKIIFLKFIKIFYNILLYSYHFRTTNLILILSLISNEMH